MAGVIKPLGTSISCNSSNSNTYGNAKLVRITCSAALTTAYTITCTDSSSATVYTINIVGGQSLILEKSPTDTLTSNAVGSTVVLGTAIAYRN
jgi:hypothetical protein